jgi:hypothetical protein
VYQHYAHTLVRRGRAVVIDRVAPASCMLSSSCVPFQAAAPEIYYTRQVAGLVAIGRAGLGVRLSRVCLVIQASNATGFLCCRGRRSLLSLSLKGDHRLRRARKSWPTLTCRPGRVNRNFCAHRASLLCMCCFCFLFSRLVFSLVCLCLFFKVSLAIFCCQRRFPAARCTLSPE